MASSKFKNETLNKKGLLRFSKGTRYRLRHVYKMKPTPKQKEAKVRITANKNVVVKKVGGAQNGSTRTVRRPRLPRYLPTASDLRRHRKRKPQPTPKLKPSLSKEGTICILLSGKQAGKRVVFLKQLEKSGHILVTGPHSLNGCPLKRVDPAYVIVTSSRIDVSKIVIPDVVNDAYFKRPRKQSSKKVIEDDDNIYADKKDEQTAEDEATLNERKAIQKKVDSQLMKAMLSQHGSMMKKYLGSRFYLNNGIYPHKLRF